MKGRSTMRKGFVFGCIVASLSLLSCATTDRVTSAGPIHEAKGCVHCLDQLAAAAKAQDVEAAYQSLANLIDQSPEALATVDTGTLAWIYNERARHVGGDELYADLGRLFDAYGGASVSREPESLWLALAIMAAERGNLDLARRAIGHLKNPHYLINVKTDRRFSPIVESDPQAFDIPNALARYIEDLRKQVEGKPRGLRIRLQLVDALLTANAFEEALRLTDDLSSQLRQTSPASPAFDDLESARWVSDLRAKALIGLGRRDEGLEELERGRRPPGASNASADLSLNLAGLLCGSGRPQQALNVLDEPLWVSPFGLMKVHLVRHWAALQMGDAEAAAAELAYMVQHMQDDPRGLQQALVVAGRTDEAVALLKYRLSYSVLRTDVLMQLQRFDLRTMTTEEKRRELAWRAFADRTDVRAALAPYGSIEYFPIGPTQGWE